MADTSYYQGDDEAASVRVSDSQIVSYGVTADNTAVEKGTAGDEPGGEQFPALDRYIEMKHWIWLPVQSMQSAACKARFRTHRHLSSAPVQRRAYTADLRHFSGPL